MAPRKSGFPGKETVMTGYLGSELIKLARRERVALMVVGFRTGRNAEEYFMGNIADAVVKYAPCSVLVHEG
jgi:nucleotide-binding universal stress UspA family protein